MVNQFPRMLATNHLPLATTRQSHPLRQLVVDQLRAATGDTQCSGRGAACCALRRVPKGFVGAELVSALTNVEEGACIRDLWFDRAASECYKSNPRPGGAVAQLGARLDGIEEVVGSNPIGSTRLIPALLFFLAIPPNRNFV